MKKRIIIEVRQPISFGAAVAGGVRRGFGFAPERPLDAGALAAAPALRGVLAGVEIDPDFPQVMVPTAAPPTAEARPRRGGLPGFAAAAEPDATLAESYIVRGEVEEDELEDLQNRAEASGNAYIYADVPIQPCPAVCAGSPPRGTDRDVERLLCVEGLQGAGLDGSGVLVAIVDTGVNMAHLNGRGKRPLFDASRSWAPDRGGTPGSQPVDHGTMCAYDACIAAPRCTLLDISLLRSTLRGATVMDALLTDAIRAYSHLLSLLTAPLLPGEARSLVVNNSWAMYDPSWDFPVGHRGNYSDNPAHPFNVIVGTLERAGADILFAAGNCGPDCPDTRCRGTDRTLYGANSHPQVLCVAGVDVTGQRAGYSSVGPGRLAGQKPDLCGFTHFAGSGVYPADGGTSAATPVVAGLIAALRTRHPALGAGASLTPAAMRDLLRNNAADLAGAGFDHGTGFGIVNGCQLLSALPAPAEPVGAEDDAQGVERLVAILSGGAAAGGSRSGVPGGSTSGGSASGGASGGSASSGGSATGGSRRGRSGTPGIAGGGGS